MSMNLSSYPAVTEHAFVLEKRRSEPKRHLARLRFVASVQEEVVAVRRLAGIVGGEVPAAGPAGVAVHRVEEERCEFTASNAAAGRRTRASADNPRTPARPAAG